MLCVFLCSRWVYVLVYSDVTCCSKHHVCMPVRLAIVAAQNDFSRLIPHQTLAVYSHEEILVQMQV